jgi:hypothetical protein
MKIKYYVQKVFATADAYEKIDSVEKRLLDNSFLIVKKKNHSKEFLPLLISSNLPIRW